MSGMTGDGIPGGDDGVDKRRVGERKAVSRGRLKRALFVSGACLLSSLSVSALSPRDAGPRVAKASAARTTGRGACELLLDRERIESVTGGGATEERNASSLLDRCGKEVGNTVVDSRSAESDGLEGEIRDMVAGYPIEAMASTIATYDREVAGLIVGIGKKESDWGKHAPHDAAGDCFNYFGLKGSGSRGIAMGYACFGSPEEAAKATGDRIAELVEKRDTSRPEQFLVWKCGSSCAGHDPDGVRRWVSDVRTYYDRIVNS
ncbi:MAG: glucosaminidase domain-containing protein [Candidatus Moranbacteria bacterium]|nr:glucosaminidase domain-containing protein [Candidatus Moranbacteria bacterium]